MKTHLTLPAVLLAPATIGSTRLVASDQRPNVLYIAVDDLNHWVGLI